MTEADVVFVVDFGAQYAQLIARRVREAHVYSEIVPHTITAAEIAARGPAALILSGGPASVYEPDAPQLDRDIYALGVPILGICYGAQLLARDLGGHVESTEAGEYGRTALARVGASALLDGLPEQSTAWMSHGTTVTRPPDGFAVTAPFIAMTKTDIARLAARLDVPIGQTWSCYRGGDVHCGTCGTCTERREAFALAAVDDPPAYLAG